MRYHGKKSLPHKVKVLRSKSFVFVNWASYTNNCVMRIFRQNLLFGEEMRECHSSCFIVSAHTCFQSCSWFLIYVFIYVLYIIWDNKLTIFECDAPEQTIYTVVYSKAVHIFSHP